MSETLQSAPGKSGAPSLEREVSTLMKDWPPEDRKRVLGAFYHLFMHLERLNDVHLSDDDRKHHEERADEQWLIAFRTCERHGPEGQFFVQSVLAHDRDVDGHFLQELCVCWNQADRVGLLQQGGVGDKIYNVINKIGEWVCPGP